jgi:hypothetical protein
MRKIFLLMFPLGLFGSSSAAEIMAKPAGGEWETSNTWVGGSAPVDGDVVVIPQGTTVTFNATPYPVNNPSARPKLTLNIYGTLDFSGAGNNKLYLDAGSSIQLYGSGKITTTTNSNEIIAIYNGATDNIVWEGTPSTISGPSFASSTTTTATAGYGFVGGILPVTLLGFTGTFRDGDVQLQWRTAEEVNTSHFVVERSTVSGVWLPVVTLGATGPNSSYSITDKSAGAGVGFYRLKIVDWDGQRTYSPVVKVVAGKSLSVQVGPNPARSLVQVSLSTAINEPLLVQLVNSNGQVAKQKQYPAGSANLLSLEVASVAKGIYTLVVRTQTGVLVSSLQQIQ